MSWGSSYTYLLLVVVFAGCTEPREDVASPANSCVTCHADRQAGFNEKHAFAVESCVTCHGGDATAVAQELAHADLIAFPGNLDNAAQTCGACHANRVESVTHGLMHTGRGMVRTTRAVVDGDPGPDATQNLQSLGHGVADSMLRKQCASCHLGQAKTQHAVNVTTDRGGGCLACHVNEHPEDAHPMLKADVSDGRCFGCHSRSGRISLSFTGLAEAHESDLRLADGRTVERLAADVHYTAGMRCTDCHDADDVMGAAGDATHQRAAVSASCTDCHEPHTDDPDHTRLTCATCHSQWAAQCFGCHMEYDADGEQWDHVDKQVTPGRWYDESWDFRNTLPALGINEAGRVDVFVPGMVLTIAHPDWDEERFVRQFAPLSPHTTGKSRSCASCHRSSTALGLGDGTVRMENGELVFEPAHALREDGLPADAWTNIGNTLGGRAPRPGQRPFTAEEMRRILGVALQQDSEPAGGSGSMSSSSSSVNTGGSNSTSGRSADPARSPTK